MRFLKTFPKGGIHPHDNKSATAGSAIKNAAISSLSIVPLQQHLGAPAQCLVQPGDKVTEEMLIGRAAGFVSTNIHAPVPGTVKEIRRILLPTGLASEAVVIELEGEFNRLGRSHQQRTDWESLSTKELLDIMADMGLVGMGGATFPIHVKYSLPKGAKAEYLIINGVECEPYLTADHRLMLERTQEIVQGIRIARKVLGPEQVVIGIEMNKPDAISAFEEAVKKLDFPVRVIPLDLKYPQGDEKQLIKAITGREVPSGKLPLDAGSIVSNVGTIHAIYEAVVLGKPLIERVLTVAGGAIRQPANLKVRIGTLFGELIEECGGFTEMPAKILAGGPMMGLTVYDLDTPVTKGTSGILALTSREVQDSRRTACIQCGRCVEACPMGLSPTTIFKWLDHLEYDQALAEGLLDCRECGCCGYICPAHIPLVQGFKVGKRISRNKKVTA